MSKYVWVFTCLHLFLLSTRILHADDMGEILPAETRSGSISFNSEVDSFTFNGETGQSVIINMCNESGFLGPKVSLYAPDGSFETSDQGNLHAEIRNFILEQSGVYTVLAQDWNGFSTGGYSLSLLLIPGPTISEQDPDGGDLNSGEVRTGSISLRADTDAYTFEADSSQSINISMSNESGYLNPGLYLYAPDGLLETYAEGTLHAEITDYQLLQSGLYTIVLRERAGDATGGYSLTYTRIPGTQHSPLVRILLNQSSFTTGDTLVISGQVTNGPNPADVEVKTWVEVPGEYQLGLLNPHMTITVGSFADITQDLSSYTFSGNEPAGTYHVGARLVDIITGREISVNMVRFSFSP